MRTITRIMKRIIPGVLFFLTNVASPIQAEPIWDFVHRQQMNCMWEHGNTMCMGGQGSRPLTDEERAQVSEAAKGFINALARESEPCLYEFYVTDDLSKVELIVRRTVQTLGLPNSRIVVFENPDGNYSITNDLISWKQRRNLPRDAMGSWNGRCWREGYAAKALVPMFGGTLRARWNNEVRPPIKIVEANWKVNDDFKTVLKTASFLNGDYIFPVENLDNKKISNPYTQVLLLTPDELRLARAEVYARWGRIFKAPDLQAHFEQKDWYEPKSESINPRGLRDTRLVEQLKSAEMATRLRLCGLAEDMRACRDKYRLKSSYWDEY